LSQIKLDEVDKQIIDLLAENSRLGVREIAKRINVSAPTISRRIRRLEDNGIIKGYVSIIENEELGYTCRAVLLIKVSGNANLNNVINQMKKNERVCNLFHTVGNYDIVMTATVSEVNNLSDFISELRTIEGIAMIESVFITSREKVLKKIITSD
jgi:DNA-binding Lrp family transcriptional regulator